MTPNEIREIFKEDIEAGWPRIFLYLFDGGGKRVYGIYVNEIDDEAHLLSRYEYDGKSVSGLHKFKSIT